MLQVTEAAVAALKDMRRGNEVADDADVRIQMVQPEGQPREGIGLTFVQQSAEGDEVVVQEGDLTVFVAGDLAAPLSDAILDVRTTGEGVGLELRDQPRGDTG